MRVVGLTQLVGNPARLVLVSFITLILTGTGLLMLPWATDGPGGAGWEDALFLSTSATTVTGLSTVDIATFSLFGELVILALIQIGGFGIMTIGSVVALVTFRRVGLRQRMLAQAEIGDVGIGELAGLIGAIARITAVVEGTLALVLAVRFWQAEYEGGVVSSLYSGVFHAIAAFNNAGISLYSDNLVRFVGDPLVTVPVSMGFILGGLGFPVYVELLARWRRSRREARTHKGAGSDAVLHWSLHTKITVGATVVLLVGGPLMVLSFEWANPGTLGSFDVFDKISNAWFQGVSPRTAGFNTIDIGSMNDTTLLGMSILMFVGAGPASTSGGIKVTTAAVLAMVLWAEVRGERDVNIFRRRIPPALVRQAVTIALLSVGFVGATSLILMASDGVTLTAALFEASSAFGTVGLTTGITPALGTIGHLVLVALMLCGRVGPLAFVTAIVLGRSGRLYRLPEERPIIG